MQNIIERFCDSGNGGGLLLLDMPTGSGKTYKVCEYICREILSGSEKKFFFMTTLKKNLPKEGLKKQFEDKGQLEIFNRKFLLVKPYDESIKDGLKHEAKIPAEITRTDEYKELLQNLHVIQNFKKQKPPNLLEKSFRDSEYNFRRAVAKALKRQFPKKEARAHAVRTDKAWTWITELYPSSLIGERQIIFMSVDKFLTPYSTIIEPASMLYNSDWVENSVIFMDEFDATKETMLRNIIGNSLRKKFDHVELFKNIYASLKTRSPPTRLTTESETRKLSREEHGTRVKPLDSIPADFNEKAEELWQEFSLDFSFKTDASKNEIQSVFLFQDHRFITASQGQASCIKWQRDEKNQINHIIFSGKPQSEAGNIPVMLGKLRGFVSYFVNGVRKLATNLFQSSSGALTLEAATRSGLKEFGLDEESINYLTDLVLKRTYKPNEKGGEKDEDDLSLYHKGFRYYSFEDDETHDLQSKIMMVDFKDTPEKLLLKFCEKAKVVGISATASLPSVIGNFDLDYIKSRLGASFCQLTGEETSRLKADFEKSVSGYDKVKIHAELIDSQNYSQASWDVISSNPEIAECLFNLVERAQPNDSNDYNKRRYFRIAVAFKKFLEHEGIHSFLCVLNKHPKENDPALNMNTLREIFGCIVREQQTKDRDFKFSLTDQIFQLDGDAYDEKKGNLLERLGNGEKCFVISVYQTIGAGQNLQYGIPNGGAERLIKINDLPPNQYKDFDAIYLDKPTNLLVNLHSKGEFKDEDFAKALFQTEFLQEAGEISMKEAEEQVRNAFKRLGGLSSTFVKGNGKCPSAVLMSTRIIIQAIGRMCRTNNKAQNIYVFADAEISGAIDTSIANGRLFNPEFLALLDQIKTENEKPKSELENKASLVSNRANREIQNMLGDWNERKMNQWKRLRKMVLRSPTLSKESADVTAKNFYVETPEKANQLYYSEIEDFKKVEVSFKKTRNAERIVSAEAAKLTELMNFPWLKEHFEKSGYATDFEPNDFIMSPPLFNNIYRGALGEVVGREIFSNWLGVELEELDDEELFELFDFKIPNTDIFIDFKNWHESSCFNKSEMLQKIARKAEKCKAKCVIIANVIANDKYRITRKIESRIEIIMLPSLLEKSGIPNQQAIKIILEVERKYGHQNQ